MNTGHGAPATSPVPRTAVEGAERVMRIVGAVYLGVELLALLGPVVTQTDGQWALAGAAAALACVVLWFFTLVLPKLPVLTVFFAMAAAALIYIAGTPPPLTAMYNQAALWISVVTLTAGLVLRPRLAAPVVVVVTLVGFVALMVKANSVGQAGQAWPDIAAVCVNALGLGAAIVAAHFWVRAGALRADIANHNIVLAATDNIIAHEHSQQIARLQRVAHNTVANTFGAVALAVAPLPPDLVAARAADDLTRLNALSATIAEAPVDTSLTKALDACVDRAAALGIHVELTCMPPDMGQLPDEVVVELAAFVDESLLNVSKHSGVTTAQVSVSNTDSGGVTVSVTDRGTGFVLTGTAAVSAVTRVAHRHMSGTVLSVPGRGTVATVTWAPDQVTELGQATRHDSAWQATRTLVPAAAAAAAATLASVFVQAALLMVTVPRWEPFAAGVIASAACALGIVTMRQYNRLPAWAGIIMAAALIPVTLINAGGLPGCSAVGQTFWGPLASATLVSVLCLLATQWWVILAGILTMFAPLRVAPELSGVV